MFRTISGMKVISMVTVVILAAAIAYPAIIYLKKFDFDEKNALDKWSRMILNGQVKYMLLKEADNGYVEALSEKTCSALYYRIGFKIEDYPFLSWKWKVMKFPDKSKVTQDKERNDYAARVYVIFPFLNFSSSKFIEYVWDENIPVGTIIKSPDGENIKVIVIRNGRIEGERWAEERRNVYDDYLQLFGQKPRLKAGAVAIMCDADGTKTEAESCFDSIAIADETGPV
jgi:hypothetical protein